MNYVQCSCGRMIRDNGEECVHCRAGEAPLRDTGLGQWTTARPSRVTLMRRAGMTQADMDGLRAEKDEERQWTNWTQEAQR